MCARDPGSAVGCARRLWWVDGRVGARHGRGNNEESIFSPGKKLVGPGRGLLSVGQSQAKIRSRDSNRSRRRWQSPAAAERWRAVPQGRGSEGEGLPV